jgi:hypothetical protein
MQALRTRQVHLDFHTSGAIDDVGADWDAQHFVETLQRAHVNSVTCFARGHHGYVYYQPTRFPKHPSLEFNLLGEQIEACHAAGIRVPIYITVGLDEYTAERHPEWLEVSPEGKLGGNSPIEARWKKLCLNSPYLDYVWEQTIEVIELFGDDVDGFFFDIIHQGECVCQYCRRDMVDRGLRPEVSEDRQRFAAEVLDQYRRRFGHGVMQLKPDVSIFHNTGHVPPSFRRTLDTFTHLEVESLPSGWGYEHFPVTGRYARALAKPVLGMTGKFHTVWGDFCSYKSQPALAYECLQMVANGAACSVGDQLPPRGRLEEVVYDLIGSVYAKVEALEPWTQGAVPQVDIGLFNVEAVGLEDGRVDSANAGALRMLTEGHHQFDVIDGACDWSGYRVVILPDKVPLDEELAAKVQGYLDQGGRILASYRAGLAPDGDAFALDAFGLGCNGEADYEADYVRLNQGPLAGALPDALHVMYERGMAVRPLKGTRILADVYAPYFDRAWDHFCSHRQTPPAHDERAGYPGVTLNQAGNVAYLAHPVFSGYRRQATPWYKKLVLATLKALLPDPLTVTDAPSTAQVTVLRQKEQQRTVVHVLHYIPERRGMAFDVIEDVIPLYNVGLAFKAPEPPERVTLIPTGQPLPHAYRDGYVHVTVPEVRGHQALVAE